MPGDASLFAPARISVPTEWIEVIRYERWPVPGSDPEPGELATVPADGLAVIARTVEAAGFLETLELDLQELIASCG